MSCLELNRTRHTPCRDLTDSEHFVIEISRYMADIRQAANENRLRTFKNTQHLSYLVGRLHGYGFGMASMLIHRWAREEAFDLFNIFCVEADFLTGEYQ